MSTKTIAAAATALAAGIGGVLVLPDLRESGEGHNQCRFRRAIDQVPGGWRLRHFNRMRSYA